MSVSSVGAHGAAQSSYVKLAPDGDTPAQEAGESSKTEQAEKANGGFAPKPAAQTATDLLNKLA
jgi:hypothetical protein